MYSSYVKQWSNSRQEQEMKGTEKVKEADFTKVKRQMLIFRIQMKSDL